MLQKVLDGYVPLTVVVEITIEETDFVGWGDQRFFVHVHHKRVEADWLSEVAQVEVHVYCHRSRVEASPGTYCPECFFQECGIVGGNLQDAA